MPSQWLYQSDFQLSLSFKINNDLDAVTMIAQDLTQVLRWARFLPENHITYMQLALIEMIVNAIEHGNLGIEGELKARLRQDDEEAYLALIKQRLHSAPYKDRQTNIEFFLTPEQATYIITDQGEGFDTGQIQDQLSPEQMSRPTGRGILLSRKLYLDELRYNTKGNQATLIKRRMPIPS